MAKPPPTDEQVAERLRGWIARRSELQARDNSEEERRELKRLAASISRYRRSHPQVAAQIPGAAEQKTGRRPKRSKRQASRRKAAAATAPSRPSARPSQGQGRAGGQTLSSVRQRREEQEAELGKLVTLADMAEASGYGYQAVRKRAIRAEREGRLAPAAIDPRNGRTKLYRESDAARWLREEWPHLA